MVSVCNNISASSFFSWLSKHPPGFVSTQAELSVLEYSGGIVNAFSFLAAKVLPNVDGHISLAWRNFYHLQRIEVQQHC